LTGRNCRTTKTVHFLHSDTRCCALASGKALA
jgi:hypothetical protein